VVVHNREIIFNSEIFPIYGIYAYKVTCILVEIANYTILSEEFIYCSLATFATATCCPTHPRVWNECFKHDKNGYL